MALTDSTLGDQDLEDCMAGALRSLSADDLPMRRSDRRQGPVAPESRALLGQTQALACFASPPCLLTLAFLIGAYRRAAGRALGYLFTDIVRPIFKEHPDLIPEEMKNDGKHE